MRCEGSRSKSFESADDMLADTEAGERLREQRALIAKRCKVDPAKGQIVETSFYDVEEDDDVNISSAVKKTPKKRSQVKATTIPYVNLVSPDSDEDSQKEKKRKHVEVNFEGNSQKKRTAFKPTSATRNCTNLDTLHVQQEQSDLV